MASTAFTCSPVSIAVEDETEVSTCESVSACVAKKGLAFASDLAFMETSIVEVVKGEKRISVSPVGQPVVAGIQENGGPKTPAYLSVVTTV